MPRLLPLALVALLAGCGQKGPLYLPAAPAPAAAPATDAAPAAGDPESEDRERAVPAAQP